MLATTLLCALLGLIAHFMKQARDSQERTEVLLAQLEDARDEQARAAAVAERASELVKDGLASARQAVGAHRAQAVRYAYEHGLD